MDCIPHIPLTVNEADLTSGASEILRLIRPNWHQHLIHFKLLTDGITNKLIACSIKKELDQDTVLVRVYGNKTDLLIDRKAETKNIQQLNQVKLAPKLYATFTNGLSYEFIPGTTLNVSIINEPSVYKLIAAHMARLHSVQVPHESREPMIWMKIEQFLDLMPEPLSDRNKNERLLKTIGSKADIEQQVNKMKCILAATSSPIVFCHNDLLLANIIYSETNKSVNFIDFEYTAYNYQAFDIGNHFAEFAGVENIDYSNYPDKNLQYSWLYTYLSVFKNSTDVPKEEIEQLYIDVNRFCLVSHLFWIIWAIIQAEHSYIDFDFIGYAATRMNEYHARKRLLDL